MLRCLIVSGLALFATGCATDGLMHHADKTPPAVTPTEQYAITVTRAPDEILLAPHADGLSAAQSAALAALVQRWRDVDGDEITIHSPGGQAQAYRAVAAVQEALEGLGVRSDQITLAAYDPGDRAGAPIAVGFEGYHAQGPACGRNWKDFTKTFQNQVNNNFGCATTANIAAMIANPADLLRPRAMDAPDAARRETVLGKYRQGAVTSSPKDPQANGAVSNTLQ
jgi:pilus assembly protein CpaD